MPEHTTFAVGSGCFFRRSDGFAHGVELMIACQYLGTLLFIFGETDKVTNNLDQSLLLKHTAEQYMEVGEVVVFSLSIYGLPFHKSVLARSDSTCFGSYQVAHHAESIIDK